MKCTFFEQNIVFSFQLCFAPMFCAVFLSTMTFWTTGNWDKAVSKLKLVMLIPV